jgi:4-amino-4-deoxy-L-arabinose transferase-like glycosyltransferase
MTGAQNTNLASRRFWTGAGLRAADSDRLLMVLILILSAIFLFVSDRTMPILLWDESRNIVNALEMKQAGLGLVTTYGGHPDLMNTKPPLLIWLMIGSVRLFGTSEWALRLPSMLATLGTLLMMMLFVRRTTGSIATAALAAIFLVLSPCLFAEHGARTADYEALLVFFVTAYLFLLFFALHRCRPKFPALLLASGAIACAVLTKSTAGLIPGLGVGLYLVVTGRLFRVWQSPRYAVAAAAALLPVILLFVAREVEMPGYLAAAWHNDAAGRFTSSLIGVEQPPTFYVTLLFAGYFSVTPFLLMSPLALSRVPARTRLVLVYSLCITAALLVVISAAASRLNHYVMPAMPFMSIAAAITLRAMVVRMIAGARGNDVRGKLIALGLAAVVFLPLKSAIESAISRRYHGPLQTEFAGEQSRYGDLLINLSRLPASRIVVIEPGFESEGKPHYAAVLLAYQMIWAERGVSIHHEPNADRIDRLHGEIVASCSAPVVKLLLARNKDIGAAPGCAAIRLG